jgi:hypothetical protein
MSKERADRLAFHLCVHDLNALLETHPTFRGAWDGSTTHPLYGASKQLVKTALYDGTVLQNHELGPVPHFEDPEHDFDGW